MHRLKVLAGAVLALALLTAGTAFAQTDFSRYVALGDSLTAGFCSGSIVQTCQSRSYPALLFQQFTGRTTGFEQPLVSTPGLPGVLTLQSMLPTPRIVPSAGAGQPINVNLPRPYDNLAVPGADVHDLLTKVQSTSPSDPTNLVLRGLGTQVQQAIALRPTFITLWIGNNDALAAATSGIVNDQTLTPLASFEADYRAAAAALAGTGARMALANIPDVTSIPFVTTIQRIIVNPLTGQPILGPNGQPIPLIGPNGPLQAGDFVLLTASTDIGNGRGIPVGIGNGTGQPLADSQVLSASEVATIRARVAAFNNVIRAVATERNAALMDANALLNDLATRGVNVGGVTYTGAFLTGGVFSYDGVHPTAFGYAFIANLFIAAINDHFDTDVEPVNLFPFMFGSSTAALTSNAIFDPAKVGPPFVFTEDARRNLLLTLGVPKWIVDGTPAPRPRRPRGGRN